MAALNPPHFTRRVFIRYFCLYHLLLSLHLPPRASSLSFNSNFSLPRSYNPQDFILQGDAYFDSQMIELTKNEQSQENHDSVGRVVYAQPVPLWDVATGKLATFNTTFSFQIKPEGSAVTGDGMAFFMGHYPATSIPNPIENGRNLGLFTNNSNTNATGNDRILAVELDTFLNNGIDTSSSHIGIDVNSIISRVYTNVTVPGKNLTSGLPVTCEVSYDNNTQVLTATLKVGDVAYHVDTSADLRQLLPSVVAIGFSGATGAAVELHRVLSWSFDSTLDVSPEPQPPPAAAKSHSMLPWPSILGITGGCAALLLLSMLAVVLYRRRHRKSTRNNLDEAPPTPTAAVPMQMQDVVLVDPVNNLASIARSFQYDELVEATNNFAEDTMLGRGGFASVYRGQLTNPDKLVAIKKFNGLRGKGTFQAEIQAISGLRHRNLVELVGWCNDVGNNHLLLVYELVSQGSLEEHLHENKSWLSWPKRYRIIRDIGCALEYIHKQCNDCVLHGDIKPCNILLDERYQAKITDFGLARLIDHETKQKTTLYLAGTPGYIDPEFLETGKRSRESDVYSFGIVLLEIVSGRRPAGSRLLTEVRNRHRRNAVVEAIDPRLLDESTSRDHDERKMERVLLIGIWCTHPDPTKRPLIAEAMKSLESNDENLEIPALPHHVAEPLGHSASSSKTSSVHASTAHDQDFLAR
ncbi:L-type lectin-domain containing receptor kinase IX.1-like [Triticum dicoccoides]|uniref:L-type lectin-domain containing receptor kinase IX.1-like n=1 Tax=Triticum dicoccoides TaxID=85692 RepID=UPI0018910A3B|nr:L-type lectin-domain containing receptor kinase IX.1-like [Triticum dicoccoides]